MKLITKHCIAPLIACIALLGNGHQQDPGPSADRQLVDAFPETRELVDHLREHQPAIHQQLTEFGANFAQSRQQRALAFADEHYPELAKLIRGQRNRKDKRAYRAAIGELCRNVARIQASQRSSEEAYEAALGDWRARSEVRMQSARMIAKPGQATEAEFEKLRKLSRTTVDAERAQLEKRAARLREQLARVEARLSKSPEEAVDERVQRVRNRMRRRQKGRRQQGRKPPGPKKRQQKRKAPSEGRDR